MAGLMNVPFSILHRNFQAKTILVLTALCHLGSEKKQDHMETLVRARIYLCY